MGQDVFASQHHAARVVTILFATTNAGKKHETEAFLQAEMSSGQQAIQVALMMPDDLPECEETGTTFLANARLKAESARQLLWDDATGERCADYAAVDYVLAEDSGFEVPVLDGRYGLSPFPGVRSNRWMSAVIAEELLGMTTADRAPDYSQLNAGLLKLMDGQVDRRARYVSAVSLMTPGGTPVFETEGDVALTLIGVDELPRGTNGFGYDPIVCMTALSGEEPRRTVAEMQTEEKNQFSHRANALKQLTDWLR